MKSLRTRILAMASVVAVSGLMMASVSGAADKLIVKDSSGANTVFKVDDAGLTSGIIGKFGVGTTTPASTFTVQDTVGVGSRGIAAYQLTNDTFAAQVDFRKAKGLPVVGQSAVAGLR